jgi:hypothetical protein
VDLVFFLKERTRFILYFYRTAAIGFSEIASAIENEEEPYVPPYSEDGEPPFLDEWMEAKTGLSSVGYSALSMLSSSLKLYLEEWTLRIENPQQKFSRKHERGWFHAYKRISEDAGLVFDNCPADLDLIEQVVLVRNLTQHPEDLARMEIQHSKKNIERYPNSVFFSDQEARMLKEGYLFSSWMSPQVFVNESRLRQAVHNVESLCSWLESQYWSARNA